jgi:hypothetical protein
VKDGQQVPYELGEKVTLPDGTSWPIIGDRERGTAEIWTQTVIIGDQ